MESGMTVMTEKQQTVKNRMLPKSEIGEERKIPQRDPGSGTVFSQKQQTEDQRGSGKAEGDDPDGTEAKGKRC